MRVLGIDTSLRGTGVGVVEAQGTRMKALAWDTLKVPASAPHTVCLRRINEGVSHLIATLKPDAAAIEGVFFAKNIRVSVILGEARGAALAACAVGGVPVYEYAPRRVKQALVGFGHAGKEQVKGMVMRILGMATEPGDDESDALALAICHIHGWSGHGALRPEPI